MRGLVWRTPNDRLKVILRLKKAVEKRFLITEYKDENSEYFFDKIFNLMNKRHTKGYFFGLAIELYSIIQKYEIYTDESKFDHIRNKKLDEFAKAITELKAEIAEHKEIEKKTDRYFEKHPEELLPDSEQD